MNKATKKWLSIKFSSLFLIPFMVWFIINFVSIINNDYNGLIAFLSTVAFSYYLEKRNRKKREKQRRDD